MVALAISRIAIALFSCKVIVAVKPSGDTAMYSGSKSWATVEPGPVILTPAAFKDAI